jgi:hypothetical protein
VVAPRFTTIGAFAQHRSGSDGAVLPPLAGLSNYSALAIN